MKKVAKKLNLGLKAHLLEEFQEVFLKDPMFQEPVVFKKTKVLPNLNKISQMEVSPIQTVNNLPKSRPTLDSQAKKKLLYSSVLQKAFGLSRPARKRRVPKKYKNEDFVLDLPQSLNTNQVTKK